MSFFKLNKECIGGCIFFLLSLFVFYQTSQFEITLEKYRGIGPADVPNALAFCLLMLSVLLYVDGIRRPTGEVSPVRRERKHLPTKAILFFCCLVLAVAGLEKIGFLVSCFLFTAIAQYILGARSPIRILAVAVCVSACVYAGFVYGLNVFLPEGILENLFS